jgi:Dolichyl-phosphate-mannose-protein mannosyltransferase
MTTRTVEFQAISRSRLRAAPGTIGVIVSLLYFGDLFLKASRKCFWYDELFTVYLCRLPDFKHTWAAVMQGADYNPPVLYLFTRGAERVFGDGLIATRLPEIVCVWLFGICLYLFVSRRVGRLSGLIAALLPFFTIIQYYAYEARPHGITLAWAGLALVCWQRSYDGRVGRGWFLWPLGFGLSLTGALLTHVYNVYLVLPFAAVELYYLAKDRRMNWTIAAAIALPLMIVLPLYLSLVRTYRATVPPTFAPASRSVIRPFFTEAMSPAIVILLFAIALLAWGGKRQSKSPNLLSRIPPREILLAALFACIPLLGLAGAMLSHGPFLPRYFLSAIAGYAMFLGFASSPSSPGAAGSWIPGTLSACMLFLMVGDLGRSVYFRIENKDYGLSGPSTDFRFGPSPQDPLGRNETLLGPKGNGPTGNQDILVLQDIEYFYLFQYAPPAVSRRFFFATPSSSNLFLGEYQRLARLAHVNLKATTFAPFLASHEQFFVYAKSPGVSSVECGDCVQEFLDAGYRLKSARRDTSGVLYQYEK